MRPDPEKTNASLLAEAAGALNQASVNPAPTEAAQPVETHQKIIEPLPSLPHNLPDLSLEPEHLIGPEEYIADSRNKGIDDITTIEHMEEHGWRSEVIVDALEHTRQENGARGTATINGEDSSRRTSKRPSYRLFAGMAAILMVVGVGSYLFPRQEEPAASAQVVATSARIADKNYLLTLPGGWMPASDNTSGSGVNMYHQPGNANTRKSRITVFVTPAGTAKVDAHAASQLSSLKFNGGTAVILSNEAIIREDHTANLQVVRAAAASNPDDITYYVYLSALYGETLYHVDAMVPAVQWEKHKDAILNSVKSLTPTNKTITQRK